MISMKRVFKNLMLLLSLGAAGIATVSEASERLWTVTIDGGETYMGPVVIAQHVSGKQVLVGTGGTGGSGIVLNFPMKNPEQTGEFTDAVEITLPGVPGAGSCKKKTAADAGQVSVVMTSNTKTQVTANFTFKDIFCKKKGVSVSGSGTVMKKKT